jgi:hypothetical protein
MASYGYGQNPQYGGGGAQNLQFYSSSFSNQPVSGHSTPFQANYGAPAAQAFPTQYGQGFAAPGVSGQMGMGESGLRTGWLAAFGTEGYDGEPPLLEELGVNFGHIQMKTLAVLNPFRRIEPHVMDDSDVAGPILFFFIFGTSLLVSRHTLHIFMVDLTHCSSQGSFTLATFTVCLQPSRDRTC